MARIQNISLHVHRTHGVTRTVVDYMLEDDQGLLVVTRTGTMAARLDIELDLNLSLADALAAAEARAEEVEDLGGTLAAQQWDALAVEAQALLAARDGTGTTARDVERLKRLIAELRDSGRDGEREEPGGELEPEVVRP